MFLRLALRTLTRVSPRLLWKAARLWAFQGLLAMRAYRRRLAQGRLFPPFLFLAITGACNLRCRGCWFVDIAHPAAMHEDTIHEIISSAATQGARYHTLLGGEPLMHPKLWDVIARHPECYFQIITNATLLDDQAADRIRDLGNVTPLLSIDGSAPENDARRGENVYSLAVEACHRLKARRVLFGVATVVTADNLDTVLSDAYVRDVLDWGAMYLWFYGYRPVGADPAPELALSREQMVEFRRRLLALRRRHPLIIIDTYWDADGRAVCPAARGLGFHIGPHGSIEPCPPLSFANEYVTDHDGDLVRSIDESRLLRDFREFVDQRTRGCVILEAPEELADFMESHEAEDTSGRGVASELRASPVRCSHHVPGEELPENTWLYRFLKKRLFFGMGAYG